MQLIERQLLSRVVIVTKIFRERSKLLQFHIFFRGMNGCTGAQIVETTTYADQWTEKSLRKQALADAP
jgi:hypothetical protein